MRDDLLQKLVEEKLLGATQQISDLSPERLYHFASCHREPRRLFTLCFLAYIKVSGEKSRLQNDFLQHSEEMVAMFEVSFAQRARYVRCMSKLEECNSCINRFLLLTGGRQSCKKMFRI